MLRKSKYSGLMKYAGEYFRVLRISKTISHGEISRTCKVAHSTMLVLETGRIENLSLIHTLCEFHGLLPSTVWIFAETAMLSGLDHAFTQLAPELKPFRKKRNVRYDKQRAKANDKGLVANKGSSPAKPARPRILESSGRASG